MPQKKARKPPQEQHPYGWVHKPLETSPRMTSPREKKKMISERKILEAAYNCGTDLAARDIADALNISDKDYRDKLFDKLRYMSKKGYFRRISHDKAPFTFEITLAGRNLLSQYGIDEESSTPNSPSEKPMTETVPPYSSLETSLASLENKLQFHLDQVDVKLQTLERLASILDPEIAAVLMNIHADLKAVG